MRVDIDDSKLRRLAADFLDMAANRFGGDTCTDWEWPDDWTPDDRREAYKANCEINGDIDREADMDMSDPYLDIFEAMSLCAEWIRGETK